MTSEVWEAIDEADGKRYALKLLKASTRENKSEIAGLKHELAVAKEINSPRVIKIYDYRVENGTPFLVMQLFSELNVKQALRRGPDALAYMLDTIITHAAEGIYHLHEAGWIHRDIKPDNFLVSREGDVKIIDFQIAEKKKTGLKKLFGGTKNIQGTRSYMSPEQIRGQVCDERSDIYSFGCVLYEMCTGKPPYTGQTPNDLLSNHLNASIPSAITNNDNVSKEFADVIKRMMAKKPEGRPPSVYEFLREFRPMQIFKKRPKPPEISVFDEAVSIKAADDMFRK
jgi:serine/threonine-protein kinase